MRERKKEARERKIDREKEGIIEEKREEKRWRKRKYCIEGRGRGKQRET